MKYCDRMFEFSPLIIRNTEHTLVTKVHPVEISVKYYAHVFP